MRHVLGWKAFEEHTNRLLDLEPTVASGSQFYDKGDGVDRTHYSETDWAYQVDAKYTDKGSFTINRKTMAQFIERARMSGKRFVMAVRLVKDGQVADYAVVPLEEFADLLRIAKDKERNG